MIARGFKSVIWVATVGGAALSCYMVSLRVATERADLARVETQIVAAKRDIRSLQTELGTRGRLTQLEQWNSDVLALSAPTSAQFVKDEVTLARLERRDATVADRSADIRMASAEVAPAAPPVAAPAPSQEPKVAPRMLPAIAPAPAAAAPLVRRASFTTDAPAVLELKAKAAPAAVATGKKPKGDAAGPVPAGKKLTIAAATAAPAKPAPAKAAPAKKLVAAAEPVRTPAADPKRSPAHAAAVKAPKGQGSDGN
jgi:hypothetical protein